MARPGKPCTVCQLPRCCSFSAEGSPSTGIHLTVEEYETIRLLDYMEMTQAQCALQMQVSRATVQSLYAQARKKLARFLVDGAYLEIEGGNYHVVPNSRHTLSGTRSSQIHSKKGDTMMKIAIPYDNGTVFQHFGHTEQFKLYQAEDGTIVSSELKSTDGQGHGALAGFLTENSVDVLICGGIGGGARNALADAGIRLYPGAVGDADLQAEAFLAGTLSYDPETVCSHHHEGEGHHCGEHHCEGHHCGN